jgi:hypothetical protein
MRRERARLVSDAKFRIGEVRQVVKILVLRHLARPR